MTFQPARSLWPSPTITRFQKALLNWYHAHKRDLPFRRTKDPYKIWLSEIMLQQTTMKVVLDYYKRFTKKFPTVSSVAKASEHDLLTLWQGLGYYSRVRNFQKACKTIVNDLGGQIPKTFEGLKKLPGIGDYTAAAIASICFDEPRAVVDGNVKRVLARLFYFKKDPDSTSAKQFFNQTASVLIDKTNAGDFNQAVMELGAMVCTPANIDCADCPVKKFCKAFGKSPEKLPIKKKMTWVEKNMTVLFIHSQTHILLKKPSENNLIKNMWELPSGSLPNLDTSTPFDFAQSRLKHLDTVHHTITNKRITARVFTKRVSDAQLTKLAHGDFKSVAWGELPHLAVSTLSKKVIASFL